MDKDEFRERIRSAREVKVRYGRANLTVSRLGNVVFSERTADAIERWRKDRATDEDVAWAFVKDRVIEHTPSFQWDEADIEKLVSRIAAVCNDPQIEARSVAALAPELDRMEKSEQKLLAESSKKFAKTIDSVIPKFDSLFPAFKTLDSLMPSFNATMPAYRFLGEAVPKGPDLSALVAPSLLDSFKTLQDQMDSAGLLASSASFRPSLMDQIGELLGMQDTWADVVKANKGGFGTLAANPMWKDWAGSLADAAREAEQSDVAQAVEETTDLVSEGEGVSAEAFLSSVGEVWRLIQRAMERAKTPAEAIAVAIVADYALRWFAYLMKELGVSIWPPGT